MKKLLPIALCAVLAGCGETTVVDLNNADEVAAMQNVMELEYRDWTSVAEKMTKSMLASGAFSRVKNPVIAMGNIKNDTMQRFDTDILTKKIRKTLLNSGRDNCGQRHIGCAKCIIDGKNVATQFEIAFWVVFVRGHTRRILPAIDIVGC